MVQAPDAATVLGDQVDTSGVQELAGQSYDRGVHERMPRDFVTMYHPNGSSSVVLLPPLGKGGKNIGDRRGKILHYIMNKRGPKGQQWWFAQPPEGWEPTPLPFRCPVEGCTRAGGLPNIRQIWMHIRHKHPEEVPMYQGVLNAIQQQLQRQVEPDLLASLGLSVETEEKAAATVLAETEPGTSDDVGGEPAILSCECGWSSRPDSKNPPASLQTHKKLHCPLREEAE